MQRVFVYGTLKKDEPNHYWLTKPEHGVGKFISKAKTKTKYPLIIATRYNIPFLLYSPGKGYQVKGELYEVDETMLCKLDELEDHPNFYIRELDTVVTECAEEECCWIYFLKTFKPALLERQLLEDYSSEGDHNLRYMDRYNESVPDDLDDDLFKKS